MTEDALDEKLPGREKYCPRCLQPLPFEGISVIHNIDSETADELGLSSMVEALISAVDDTGLGQKIAFVSTESFHITTFDLVNHKEHAAELAEKGYEYSQVRADVETAAINFINHYPRLAGTVEISGLDMYCPRVLMLKLNLSIGDNVAERFQKFRLDIHRRLGENVNGYWTVRKKSWNDKLSGHITFGYVVNPLDEPDIKAFLDILKRFNDRFDPMKFELTQGEVTRFTDMDHYFVV
jgi:hypothetical protein